MIKFDNSRLEKCYNHVSRCKKCKRKYGYDKETDSGKCPICTFQEIVTQREKLWPKSKAKRIAKMRKERKNEMLSLFSDGKRKRDKW